MDPANNVQRVKNHPLYNDVTQPRKSNTVVTEQSPARGGLTRTATARRRAPRGAGARPRPGAVAALPPGPPWSPSRQPPLLPPPAPEETKNRAGILRFAQACTAQLRNGASGRGRRRACRCVYKREREWKRRRQVWVGIPGIFHGRRGILEEGTSGAGNFARHMLSAARSHLLLALMSEWFPAAKLQFFLQ